MTGGAAEDEQEHLLRSIEDLDREHAAGDLSDEDHVRLRREYTARAAAVLRGEGAAPAVAPAATDGPARRSPLRTAGVLLGVLAVAALAGTALARGVGQRGGGGLTGDAGGVREQLAACQPLAFREPAKGVECYRKILATAPDDLDALTYQGWALVRAGRQVEGARRFAKVVELDPDYPDVRVFRAVLASRAERWTDAAAEIDRFFRNDPPPVAVQVLRTEGLEFKVFIGLQPPATRACWVSAAKGLDPKVGFDQPFIDRLAACLDTVLAATPTDRAALFSRALSSIGPDRQDVAGARRLLDGLLAEDPANADALLLRARLDLADGRLDAAGAAAERLARLPRPTAAFLVGDAAELTDAVARARTASTTTRPSGDVTTTTSASTVRTAPGAPSIPNPDGG